jgi:ClpP class serine protease
VHTAGNNKSRLDPFLPEKAEDVEWLTGLQTELHTQFKDWIRGRRGDKLRGTDEELFTGEVWTGAAALERGLIDGLGTFREIIADRFPDAEPVVMEGKKPLLARLGLGGMQGARGAGPLSGAGLGASAVDELLAAAETRAAWARYGL